MAKKAVVAIPVARGGFGRVERIEDGGQVYARKTFDPGPRALGASTAEKLRERFRREVLIQSRLSSDFFIPVVAYDLDTAEPWFTMPYAPRNYEEKIDEDRAKGAVDRTALSDILAALEELHGLGYAHRDLKPANILFHDGRWKLSDFGLILPLDDETTAAITSANSAWGSRDYCSPEQAAHFHNVTTATDIYSFGCILHDVVARDDEYRFPYQRATCDGPVGPIIEKCTEVKAKARFRDVATLRDALMRTLASTAATPSVHAAEWITRLGNPEQWDPASWDSAAFRLLVRALRTEASVNDAELMFGAIDERHIRNLFDVDPDVWEELVSLYCDWVRGSGFPFDFCDLLARRLEVMFGLGSLSVMAAVSITLARLGHTHNRWYVMRKLMLLCGRQLPDKVAERIAIEIVAEGAGWDFYACATGLDRDVTGYHPAIAAVAAPPSPKT